MKSYTNPINIFAASICMCILDYGGQVLAHKKISAGAAPYSGTMRGTKIAKLLDLEALWLPRHWNDSVLK